MDRALIIADDFTGANDTGVQLTKRGINTQVVLEGKNISKDSSSYVLDTESRSLTYEEAYSKIKKQLQDIPIDSFDLVYKKIDSTLRGNITSELRALDEEYKPELIIFAPAFPDIGRETKGAIHFVNGNRITETEFSKDPQKPVLEDNIQKIIQSDYSEAIKHHSLEDIRTGKVDLNNERIHTFDVENNQDLERIVLSANITGKRILWVGSAGLANIILNILRPFKPSLGVVGSLSGVSRKQVEYAKNKGVEVLQINMEKVFKDRSIGYIVDEAVNVLLENKDLIITSSYDIESYNDTLNAAKKLSIDEEEISLIVSNILGDIAREVIKRVRISGLFITGGDTAMGFIKSTKSTGSYIIEEIMTGIPLMKLNNGEFAGLNVVTKAGAFGNDEALYYSLNKLKEEI